MARPRPAIYRRLTTQNAPKVICPSGLEVQVHDSLRGWDTEAASEMTVKPSLPKALQSPAGCSQNRLSCRVPTEVFHHSGAGPPCRPMGRGTPPSTLHIELTPRIPPQRGSRVNESGKLCSDVKIHGPDGPATMQILSPWTLFHAKTRRHGRDSFEPFRWWT